MNYQDRLLYDMFYFHGTHESADQALRAMALLWNFHPYYRKTQTLPPFSTSPFEDFNGFCYHDSWLHNLLIAASMNGRRSPRHKNTNLYRTRKFLEESSLISLFKVDIKYEQLVGKLPILSIATWGKHPDRGGQNLVVFLHTKSEIRIPDSEDTEDQAGAQEGPYPGKAAADEGNPGQVGGKEQREADQATLQ